MNEVLARADGLAAGYGTGAPVLREVSFEAPAGARIAVLGPNGGGKTTLFRALLGELHVSAGSVSADTPAAIVAQTERSRLDFPVSALDVATMGSVPDLAWWRRPGRAERARAREALAAVGLEEHAGASFGELSGGQRQRVLIARALVQRAQLLLLDEPFTGVDAASAQLLSSLLDELAADGRALLIATHDVEQARQWDLVLCLNRRQIAFGRPEETLTRDVLAATYGGSIVTLPGSGERVILPADHHHGDDNAHGHSHGDGH